MSQLCWKTSSAFNANLHLCCLLTYGCLLRPHREIRLLTWEDYEELTRISLSVAATRAVGTESSQSKSM